MYTQYEIPQTVMTANSYTEILGEGTVILSQELSNGTMSQIRLHPVLYMPTAMIRLLSNGSLCAQGLTAKQDNKKIIFSHKRSPNIPYMEGFPMMENKTLMWITSDLCKPKAFHLVVPTLNIVNWEIWHQHLGHPSKQVIKMGSKTLKGFPPKIPILETLDPCKGCVKGKATSDSFPDSEKRATKSFELIHTDLMEMPIASYNKQKYIMVLLDDYTSHVWTLLIQKKSDVFVSFQHWYTLIKNKYSTSIVTLRSDQGGEFTSKQFEEYLKTNGITHQMSTPHIHQQNGRAERINRTIREKSEAMRLHASCPPSWWNFAIETSIHMYNCTPLRRTNWCTPIENLTKDKPDISYFKVFGCTAWVYIPSELHKNKLSPKSEEMTFIGYELNAKAYRFMTHDNKLVISTQAQLNESKFPRESKTKDIATKNLDKIRTSRDKEDFNPSINLDDIVNHNRPNYDTRKTLSDEQHISEPSSDDDDDNYKDPSDKNKDDSDVESFKSVKSEKDQDTKSRGVELDQPSDNPESDLEDAYIGDKKDKSPSPPPRPKTRRKAIRDPDLPLQCSSHLKNPIIQPDNTYGDKPILEIEKEISEKEDALTDLLKDLESKESSSDKEVEDLLSFQVSHTANAVCILKEKHQQAMTLWTEKIVKENGVDLIKHLFTQAVYAKDDDNVPYDYRDIIKMRINNPSLYQQWKVAMDEEIKSLQGHKIWILSDLPPGRTAIKCRWVFILKSDGKRKA